MYLYGMDKIDAEIIKASIAVTIKGGVYAVSTDKRFRFEFRESLFGHITEWPITNEREAAYHEGYIEGALSMWLARARNSYNLTFEEYNSAIRLIKKVAAMVTADYEIGGMK